MSSSSVMRRRIFVMNIGLVSWNVRGLNDWDKMTTSE